uniref:Ig-like domain-containing protein n=1 Tax=Scleropages formosus TaxID=113540 RepID=A0A8C9WEX4_SCLFO
AYLLHLQAIVSSTATDVTKTEGESLVFECQMSTQTFQHTHLSLTWYLQGESDSQVQPIISLDKDLTVRPGKAFESRYTSGFISVDKVDETTYKLEISKLQVTDQGKISCEGSEWIQDPDRSWYRLGQKNVTVSSVQVQPLSEYRDFVQVESPNGGVREGEVLQLKCTVEAQKIQERYFSVAWLKDGREVAHMDPRGVVSISQEYEARDREGEMKVWKSSNRDYVLFIKPVRVMDTGEYQCRVWKEEKGAGGVFTQGRSQDSSVERVAVTVPESNLVVTVPSAAVSVTQGSLLQLACQVSGAKGQVSVAWQHRSDKGTTVDVINLSRSGVMEPGAQYRQRVQAGNVRALRPTASNFTLEIANVLLTDSGVYRCTATDWVTERDDKVKNIDTSARTHPKSRNVRVTENDTVELICTVKRPEAPLSVTWKFQPTGTPSQADIVLLTHNGDITWFKELRNYQLRVQAQAEETRVVLRIMRASASEAGAYQCVVDAFLQQVQTSRKLSNKLSVIVSRPESSLSIATGPQPLLEHDANSDVRMECRILKATSNSSRFAVTWQLQRPGEKNQTVVSMDHDSVLSDPGEAERYSLRRHDAQLFELLVPRVETRDSGQYHCLVEEWLQNSHGVWYSLPAKSDLLERIRFYRPAIDTFSLTIQRVCVEDGGEYSCEVAEYQTDRDGNVMYIGSSKSGITNVRVLLPESNLRVQKKNHTMTVSGRQGEGFTVDCQIVSRSTDKSVFEVTWWRQEEAFEKGSPYPIFRVQRDFTLQKMDHTRHGLFFSRPRADMYSLAVTNAELSDGGQYYCWVEEWQLTPRNTWRKMAEDMSGSLTVLKTRTRLPHFSVVPQSFTCLMHTRIPRL